MTAAIPSPLPTSRPRRLAALLSASAVVLTIAGGVAHAAPRPVGARFAAGPDVNRDPCTATRSWSHGTDLREERDQPFVITCRGSAEQRGWIDVAVDKPVIAPDLCGAAQQASLDGLGAVTLRRCLDPRFAGETIVVETGQLRGSAMPGALAPLVAAMRALRQGSASDAAVTIDPALAGGLAPLPAGAAAARNRATIAPGGLDVQSAITQGLAAIYAGRNVEASRLLNDSIAQFAGVGPLPGAELRLNAGLADSNIGEFASAEGRFAAADALLAAAPPSPLRARLIDQAVAYRALHAYNQGRWQQVLDVLVGAEGTEAPLSDTATLARLNSASSGDLRLGLDTDQINQLILLAQRSVAQSVAFLRLGKAGDAQAALLDAKARGVDPAEESLGNAAGSLNWLRARLERQQGRIKLARGDVAGALASFDCALATMHAVARPAACLFADDPERRGTPLAGPAIADAELERTAVLARQPGVDRTQVMARYEEAVATLAGQSEGGFVVSPLLGPYLDLLATDAARGDARAAEMFFAALQTVREPGVARELAALQAQVSGGAAGGLVRERQDLERRRSQLRYEAGRLPSDSPQLAAVQAENGEVSARLDQVNTELARSGAATAVDDKAATLAELRAPTGLRDGEIYLKLSAVGDRLFGAAVSRDAVTVYAVEGTAGDVQKLAGAVLRTAKATEGSDGRLRIRPFRADLAYELFARVAGPAGERLRASRAVIADVGATLEGLPVSLLVTQPVATATIASADYGQVPFLVRSAELASALSPRAFMRVRTGLRPSPATEKLIGFGAQAMPPEGMSAAVAQTPITLSAACSIPYGVWAESALRTRPIPVDEIRAGAAAIGDAGAPIVTGADFTNAAIIAASEEGRLSRYQVIHFATHGSSAVPIPGCETPLPPALATTVVPPEPGAPSRSNGVLGFMDIARLHLDANLVILSACETGTGTDTEFGREAGVGESSTLDGLVRAFTIAQARAVLATYWKVPAQRGTEDLIKSFYLVGRTGTMGDALRQAQMSVLSQPATSHPFYWGAFFLVGDGAKTMFTPPAQVAGR